MAKLRYSEGSVSIAMDDTLERLVRRALDEAAPGVVDRITAETAEVHRLAVSRWPVDTGRSKAGLREEIIVSPDSVRGRIMNDVEYAPYVRPRWTYNTTTAWSVLVQRPMRAAAERLVKTLGPVLRRALEGR